MHVKQLQMSIFKTKGPDLCLCQICNPILSTTCKSKRCPCIKFLTPDNTPWLYSYLTCSYNPPHRSRMSSHHIQNGTKVWNAQKTYSATSCTRTYQNLTGIVFSFALFSHYFGKVVNTCCGKRSACCCTWVVCRIWSVGYVVKITRSDILKYAVKS